ncbi:MAG: DUF4118 domain-containing protein [Candidatus Devosia phytovorans]|uniref:histidine kinase n=1 Tax=Candidatus Devosia phytovorans TaxID=3121372 RepID=A0AAJ5VUT6_9HYPH|nr:histidine kinase dimerization/phosphoacceptor domain -containing protein [Devosia sp.]WEK04707.1 MAG: DUF4118 domain-containing protein [Devosia sp.]
MTNRFERASKRLLRFQATPWRWAAAAVAFALALSLRMALHDSLPPGYPFLTFFPAVILTAFIGGLLPGAVVALGSFLASWYFFIPPFDTFELNPPTALALVFFATVITVDLLVIHQMFRWLSELDQERQRSANLAASRDLMFQELQHRVSNNLSVVASLIRMQRRNVADQEAARVLDEAANRLALIGKIQRRLHDPNGQMLALGQFAREICDDLLFASGATSIKCSVVADDTKLSAERAVPTGLIIAELVANSVEHAFGPEQVGLIEVHIERLGAGAEITVRDNGQGLPADFNLSTSKSLGLTVARRFAEQLGDGLSMETDHGTVSRLRLDTL